MSCDHILFEKEHRPIIEEDAKPKLFVNLLLCLRCGVRFEAIGAYVSARQ